MNKNKIKLFAREKRHRRVRAKIIGTEIKPRLSVFKSNRGIYAQIIDDVLSHTLASVHAREIKDQGDKTAISFKLGKLLARKAQEKNISVVVFDKGGYKYHGRIKALADGAREGGLKF
jgi:large subunit ribosomal protein L18